MNIKGNLLYLHVLAWYVNLKEIYMSISPISFSGNIQETRQKGGAGKAVASALIPGSGQFLDGRNKEGATYLGGSIGLGVASSLVGNSIMKNMAKSLEQNAEVMPKTPTGKLAAIGLIGLAATGLWIANIVDAYKGGKQEAKAPVEKANEIDTNA